MDGLYAIKIKRLKSARALVNNARQDVSEVYDIECAHGDREYAIERYDIIFLLTLDTLLEEFDKEIDALLPLVMAERKEDEEVTQHDLPRGTNRDED